MRSRTDASSSFILMLACLAVTLVSASPAVAQPDAGRSELTVFAGASLASPKTDNLDFGLPVPAGRALGSVVAPTIYPGPLTVSAKLGGSAEFGARYDWYLTDIISVGGDFSIAPSHELSTTIRFGCPDGRFCIAEGVPALVLPDQSIGTNVVAYHYGGNVGIDLLDGDLRPTVIAGVGAVSYEGSLASETQFAFRIGGAFKADAGPVVIRLEAIDVITPDHFISGQAEHDLHVRVGIGVRW